MQKWDYAIAHRSLEGSAWTTVIELPGGDAKTSDAPIDVMNQLGLDGWEFVAAQSGGSTRYQLYFKRLVE